MLLATDKKAGKYILHYASLYIYFVSLLASAKNVFTPHVQNSANTAFPLDFFVAGVLLVGNLASRFDDLLVAALNRMTRISVIQLKR